VDPGYFVNCALLMLFRFGHPSEFVALFRAEPSLSAAALVSKKRPETRSGTCWIASCLGNLLVMLQLYNGLER
jgi:hypothetical protein